MCIRDRYSSRWRDFFGYGQVKTELRTSLPVHPYVSTRFVGDTRRSIGAALPQYLSESSVILGLGLATRNWHGAMAWGEAGSSFQYLTRHMVPDYRGGVSFLHNFGRALGSDWPGWFFEPAADLVYVSRFDHGILVYSQNRVGYTPDFERVQTQFFWNLNFTMDQKRQAWANFAEFGPGVRFRWRSLPPGLFFTFSAMRGAYTLDQGGARAPYFSDFRAGFWYAVTH